MIENLDIFQNDETNNIKVYVSEDGKLHFVDKDGADTVLNFNSSNTIIIDRYYTGTTDGNNSVSYSNLYFTGASHVDVGQVTMINPDHYNKELSFNIYDNDTNDNLYSTRVPVNDVSVDIDSSITSIRLSIYGWQTVLYNIVIS